MCGGRFCNSWELWNCRKSKTLLHSAPNHVKYSNLIAVMATLNYTHPQNDDHFIAFRLLTKKQMISEDRVQEWVLHLLMNSMFSMKNKSREKNWNQSHKSTAKKARFFWWRSFHSANMFDILWFSVDIYGPVPPIASILSNKFFLVLLVIISPLSGFLLERKKFFIFYCRTQKKITTCSQSFPSNSLET